MPKTEDKDQIEDSRADKNLHRNQIVTTALASSLITLVLAAYLGAFSSKTFENLTDWLAVIIAATAAAISFYAVLLVSKTLEATRETLKATQEMAADTRRIGHAQLRPWVLLESCKLIQTTAGIEIEAVFKNYGVSPAMFLTVVLKVECYSLGDDKEFITYDKYGMPDNYLGDWNEWIEDVDYLGPDRTFNAGLACFDRDYYSESVSLNLVIEWHYRDATSGENHEEKYYRDLEYDNERFHLV